MGAFPATASFSRSAVNHNSGVRTPLGGVVTGGLVLAALSALSTYFGYIPETVLATIIITSVLFMANPADVLIIWRTNPIDILPYIITFTSALFIGLEVGILIGIGVSIMILLYHMARPHIFAVVKITPANHPFLYVKPDRSIFFSSIDYMKIKIDQNLKDLKQYILTRSEGQRRYIVVVDGEHMFQTDSTFALVRFIMVTFSAVLLTFLTIGPEKYGEHPQRKKYISHLLPNETQCLSGNSRCLTAPNFTAQLSQ